MDKLTALICSVICILAQVNIINPTYQLPRNLFCEAVTTGQEIKVSDEGEQYIINLLNEASWRDGSSDCDGEYVFFTRKQELLYHAVCGTFQDLTNQTKTTLPDEERMEVNRLLGVTTTGSPEGDTDQPKQRYKVTVEHPDWIINQLESEYEAGEEVTVIVPFATDCWPTGYVNGVSQPVNWADDNFTSLSFTFVMPCEDVLIETGSKGIFGRCYFPHIPHPDWIHSLVCEGS